MKERLTAAILAGGKGSRLIAHKGLLEIEGKAIIKRQLEILRPIFDNIIIVTNSPQAYKDLGARLVSDIILGKGPLGGIYSALKQSATRYNFVVASDMPYLNSSLIKYMCNKIKGYAVTIPEFNGVLQPLYAFYAKECLFPIEKQIMAGNFKIRNLLSLVKVRKIPHSAIAKFDQQGTSFININTAEEYQKVKLGAYAYPL